DAVIRDWACAAVSRATELQLRATGSQPKVVEQRTSGVGIVIRGIAILIALAHQPRHSVWRPNYGTKRSIFVNDEHNMLCEWDTLRASYGTHESNGRKDKTKHTYARGGNPFCRHRYFSCASRKYCSRTTHECEQIEQGTVLVRLLEGVLFRPGA